MSAALEEIRRNATFYADQVKKSRRRLTDALEKHRYERERLEQQLAEDEAKARDFQLVVDAAEASLASNQDRDPASEHPAPMASGRDECR